jgi:hypothetical protein
MDTYGYYGWGWTGFRDIIYSWQQIGVFDVILPLLLVFAVVYSILDKIKALGENKAINVIVALILAFFAVSNIYISNFFMYLFSYTGIAIAILLAAIVLLGLFAQEKQKAWPWIFGFGGFALFVWVLSRAITDYGITFFGQDFGWWITNNIYWILPILFVVGAIIAVVFASGKSNEKSILEKLMKKQNYN